jgi:hypothetical protein
MSVPAWLWPRKQHSEAGWNHRLGRVLHWAASALASAIFFFGVYAGFSIYRNHLVNQSEIATWDATHKTSGNEVGVTDMSLPDDDIRPIDYPLDWGVPLMFFAAGGLVYITGRGVRYIIAGE